VRIVKSAVFLMITVAAFGAYAWERLDGIAAVVGDEIIMNSELEAYAYMRMSAMRVDPRTDTKELMHTFLNELIDNKVLLVQARGDTTISVRNDEVESALNNHISMILQQNGITMEQLEMQLRIQQGTTLARFKSDARRTIREQLLKQKLQQSYYFAAKINRRDVEQFFAAYKDSLPEIGESFELSKLSLKLTPSDSIRQAASSRIQAIKRQLNNGADFEELAKELSEGPEGAAGGNLGFISKGSTTELAFEERAFTMGVGEISEPFETRLGFHIIQVTEKRDRRVRLRQIMVRLAPGQNQFDDTSAKLDSIRGTINSREDFEKTARAISADDLTRMRGGSMGWVSMFEISADLRNAIQNLEEGGITAPIMEDGVMSIYRVNSRAESRKLSLENDYPIIAEKAKDIFAQKKLIETVARWREKVFIDIRI
jgi:peptidyl-prolyl cis-trans isomerase SurA